MTLLPALRGFGADRADAVTVAGGTLSSEALLGCVTAVADRIRGAVAVAVDGTPTLETVVGMLGAVHAGVPLVPLPPDADECERGRILRQSGATVLLGRNRSGTHRLPTVPVDLRERSSTPHPEPAPGTDAVILYTGGAGGPSRGVRISRRAIAADLDLLADAWRWNEEDVVVQGAPLFRAYGLVVGLLGALRVGSRFVHLDRNAAAGPVGTMYLGLPEQWAKIALNARWARSLSAARILISADAPLACAVAERLRLLTSHTPVQAYGTTETLIALTGRADDPTVAGAVGTPLPGVETRVLDREARPVPADGESVGELSICGPTLFSGYVEGGRGHAAGHWHATGDLATVAADGSYRIIGRRGLDVLHCRGRRMHAGQIEEALLSHPGVREAAVVGTPHDALGEQVTAYVVAEGLTAQVLIDHVGRYLSAGQRPRRVHFVDELPRSALGRIRKSLLIAAG
ncbi:AMP-binding protein [Micromonospora sp. DSM 115977]|uniref:AMP-binding protein n=1 Tax=Micromonospora reichwaldensis TaxID=3075516 RepID=A0ABU2WPA9_9ACTN|nr:AMP-binding protein [Micromonospora sp. DSM 115977]MDT0527743.1 AMP-binding protein [Micromonospora sp. DSM 115977]